MDATTSIPPLYIKNTELSQKMSNPTVMDLIEAVVRVVTEGKLVGIQRLSNLWLIYLSDAVSRLEIYTKGELIVSGVTVTLYDDNPYTMQHDEKDDRYNRENHRPKNDKLTIKNLPLHIKNEEVKTMLEAHKIEVVSSIRYGYIRDRNGELTKFTSGDRYVYVKAFNPPIQRRQKVGDHPCIVFHHGKENPCIACGQQGHRVGQEDCKAKPKEKITAFRGHEHPLSNLFPCEINIFETVFKSVDHALFWRMALEKGKPDLARKIQEARHAGIAKRISKEIAPDEERWQWEKDNVDYMIQLLHAKQEQCPEFAQCLFENRNTIIAEATNSKYWGTGFSPYVTINTDPKFWPGQNILGSLLNSMADQLVEELTKAREENEKSPSDDKDRERKNEEKPNKSTQKPSNKEE